MPHTPRFRNNAKSRNDRTAAPAAGHQVNESYASLDEAREAYCSARRQEAPDAIDARIRRSWAESHAEA
jgi:hypothetical protein